MFALRFTKIAAVVAVICACAFPSTLRAQKMNDPKFVDKPGETYFDFGDEPIRYIENDRVKIGFDLSLGGAIVFMEDKARDKGNIINSFDWGRQIQLSYYSGPVPYVGPNGEQPAPNWAGLGWNPIQAGDFGGFGSRVLEFKTSEKGAFVRTRPMLWPNSGVLAECLFECKYLLTDNGFELTATIINDRSDKTQYLGRNQETPAVYTNAPWYKLVSYLGDKPFEGEPTTVLVQKNDGKGWPWISYYSPERWTALVDDDGWGLGVYQPNSLGTSAGFHGGDGAKGQPLGSKSGPTGYIAPREVTILDWNIKRSYKTTFIVGNLDEIRKTVYRLAKRDLAKTPNWVFENDRQNWTYANTTDEGWPISGALKINLLPNDQALAISPETFWKANDADVLEIDLELEKEGDGTREDNLEITIVPVSPADTVDYVSWSEGAINHIKDREEKQKTHPVLPEIKLLAPAKFDGARRTLRVNLKGVDGYQGAMRQARVAFPKSNGKAILRSVKLLSDDQTAK